MYQLRNHFDRRIKNQFIVLTQSINLIDTSQMINPIVYNSSYKYTWGLWQEYFLRDLYKPVLPVHYFTELLDKDYVIYKGLADQTRSYFLKDLADNQIIYPHFREAILVGIDNNFDVEIPEQRMYDHLVQKVILPLMYQYNISFNNVRILDDCTYCYETHKTVIRMTK